MSSKKRKMDLASSGKPELRHATQQNNDEVSGEQLNADRKFAELVEQANAVDRVMTKNGPPEDDWTSG